MLIREKIYGLLEDTIRICSEEPCASVLLPMIRDMKDRLDQPLRVAVVGIEKAGKSTFMNTLLGEKLVLTGILETTYTVCWFRYGKEKSITICFRNGTTREVKFDELKAWSAREGKKVNEELNQVKYLIIRYPNEVLKQFEFIDTPGLNSIYQTDSQNTLDVLQINGSKDTLYEASVADAIIYAYNRSAGSFDLKILEAFREGNETVTSPINSIGIMTKVDATGIWNVEADKTPVELATTVTKKDLSNSNVKRCLYTILPVCAKVVEGYSELTSEDWNTLYRLEKRTELNLQDDLMDASDFANSQEIEFMELGSTKVRKHLMDTVGQYGVFELCRQLHLGYSKDQIGEILPEICGIQPIKDLLKKHFGNRSFLIKTQFILERLRAATKKMVRTSKDNRLKEICSNLNDKIDSLYEEDQRFREIEILRQYYNGVLEFEEDEELEEFLQITGEDGNSVESRLGVKEPCTVLELEQIALRKAVKWRGKGNTIWMSRAYIDAANTIARSYEEINYILKLLNQE